MDLEPVEAVRLTSLAGDFATCTEKSPWCPSYCWHAYMLSDAQIGQIGTIVLTMTA